jgi:glycosyltransferase involved in cell wall biosynthesis
MTILARLDRTRFDPVVICPETGPLQQIVAQLGVPLKSAAVLHARFTWRLDLLLRYLKSIAGVIRNLRKQVKEIGPDLIHANSVRAGLVATAATLGMGTTVVWHIHDLLPRHPFNPMIRAVAGSSSRTRMIAVAKASADRFAGCWPVLRRRTTVIRNGIDLDRFRADATVRKTVRTQLKLNEGPVVGIVGRITPGKGQLELIQTFPRILTTFPNATLLIVGSPAFNREHDYLQLLECTAAELGISSRVRLLGARDDVPAIMQALDLAVLNSSSEACCLVALEAMASGAPVLATAVGGTPEIIRHGHSGWLVQANDPDMLAEAMVTLLRDKALRRQLSVGGRQQMEEDFSIERFARDIDCFYQNLSKPTPNQKHPEPASELLITPRLN